jgi:hypothetical protein
LQLLGKPAPRLFDIVHLCPILTRVLVRHFSFLLDASLIGPIAF